MFHEDRYFFEDRDTTYTIAVTIKLITIPVPNGTCTNPPDLNCDDGDLCTTDSCDAVAGCAHLAVVCDDQDPHSAGHLLGVAAQALAVTWQDRGNDPHHLTASLPAGRICRARQGSIRLYEALHGWKRASH